MDLTKKQYEKMMSNKPAKKQTHYSLATMIGAKNKALTVAKNKRLPYSSAAKADMEEARKYPRLHKK